MGLPDSEQADAAPLAGTTDSASEAVTRRFCAMLLQQRLALCTSLEGLVEAFLMLLDVRLSVVT